MDLNKICGICLQESTEMTSLLDQDQDLQITISEKIKQCFPDIYEDYQRQNPTSNVCEYCILDLDSAYRFRRSCETALQLSNSRESECIFMQKIEEEENSNNDPTEYQEPQLEMDIIEEHLDDLSEANEETNDEIIDKLPPTTSRENRMKKTKLTRHKTRKVQSFKNLNKKKSPNSVKICEICGNTYKYQHALNSHMRRHTNDKPFGCEFCDKAFVSNVELLRHMRVHTGVKPYSCSYCERKFSDYGSRIKHERTHTGERPFSCPTCHKSFAYAHVLSVHLRTHTGEKKFKCPWNACGKGFTKKSYMLAHIEQHKRSSMLILKEEEDSYDVYLPQDTPIYDNIITQNSDITLEPCITTYIVEEIDSDELRAKGHKNININVSAGNENILGIEEH